MSNQQLIDKYTERNQKIKDYIDNRPTMGVVDIELSDYIIGLENDALTDSFYNVIERDVYKTNNPNKEIVLSYQGCGGIFQTDNKVHVISYASYHTVDKSTDVVDTLAIDGLIHLFFTFNRTVCELDDYFVVFYIFTPNAYLLINKHTDEVTKIPFNGLTSTSALYYCNVKDNASGRFNSQLNGPLTNGNVIWYLPSYSGMVSSRIICLTNFLTGDAYETSAATTYCFAAGAICADNGILYIPYNSTTAPPITSIRKYSPTSGLPFTTINLPYNLGLFPNQCQGFKFANFIFYLGYDTSVGPNKIHAIKINTNNDSIYHSVVTTEQYKVATDSRIFGTYFDEANFTLYVTYQTGASTAKIASIQLSALFVTQGNPTLISLSENYLPPGLMKRNDEDGIVIMTLTNRGSPNAFNISIINNDLTYFLMNTVYAITDLAYYVTQDLADYFDMDDEYIYLKPYRGTELIKIHKTSRYVERVPLPAKASYVSASEETVKVTDNGSALILPAWEYKNGVVNNIIEDESLTPGKSTHVLDSTVGFTHLFAGGNIYFAVNRQKPSTSSNPNTDAYLERITLNTSSELIYVWNGEEVPYKY